MEQKNKKMLQFFSALADETRLKILLCLSKKPQSVNEIHESIGKDKMTLSAVSHQLTLLTNLDIIIFTKIGRQKTFQLSDNFCWCVFDDAFGHFKGGCKHCAKIKGKNGKHNKC